jgi:hypothetical protein
MKRKILTPAVLAVALLLVTGVVWADSNWEGIFWENNPPQLPGIYGTWEGTLYSSSILRSYFLGTWSSDVQSGTCGGIVMLTSTTGDCYVLKGWAEANGDTLYDCWKGCFNKNTGKASGTWGAGAHSGEWKGKMVE